MRYHKDIHIVVAAGLAIGAAGVVPPLHSATDPPTPTEVRLDAMRARGTEASLTVLPVVMGDAAFSEVANVVGLLLEQAGMTHLDTTATAFRLPDDAEFAQAADLFGAFIRQNPISTDYALYAEFVGNPAAGVREIRGIIVDRKGAVVWADRQTSEDRLFQQAKPECPMSCSNFLAQRLVQELQIPSSARDESGKGKFAQVFADQSGTPDQAEWSAIGQRQAKLKDAGPSATIAVLPVRRSNDEVSVKDATQLATLLNQQRLCNARVAAQPVKIQIQPARNEQKGLWDLARALKDHLRHQPPAAEYVMLADYIMAPGSQEVWAVHFVICDRQGEWVIVDFQNNHHSDFTSIDPHSADDCGRLVARRLNGYLR